MHRQGQNRIRAFLSADKRTRCTGDALERFLCLKRKRVVYHGRDSTLFEPVFQPVASSSLDFQGVLVVDVRAEGHFCRSLEKPAVGIGLQELFRVITGGTPPGPGIFVQMFQFHI